MTVWTATLSTADKGHRVAVGLRVGELEDPVLVGLLVLTEHRNRVLVRVIVDELVTYRAQQHQVVQRVDLVAPIFVRTSWPRRAERPDVRHLGEVPVRVGQVVLQEVDELGTDVGVVPPE